MSCSASERLSTCRSTFLCYRLPEHPESFPVNTLVPIPGTPLEKNDPVPVHTVIRTVATARIVMPKTIIRLAAGRHTFSETEQAMVSSAAKRYDDHDLLTHFFDP